VAIIYVDTSYYLTIFLAFTLGGPLGMFYVDKRILKREENNISKIIAGFLLGVFGTLLVQWILPTIYDISIVELGRPILGLFLFLLVTVFFSLIGYNSVELFRRDKKNPIVD